jgi:hypothetical protein
MRGAGARAGAFDSCAPTVAIVGMGPKGLYCLERLVAEFAVRPLAGGLRLLIFNRSVHFGASPVYDVDQPDYVLVNNSVGEIDLWDAEGPSIAAKRGPDFLSWYQAEFPSRTPLGGAEYLSRAVVGRYLRQGFARVMAHLPAGISVRCLAGEVVDIEPVDGGYVVHLLEPDGERSEFAVAKVLLATGHSRVRPGPEERSHHNFAHRHAGACYIPFAYPVAAMDAVPAGARVATKGIGLTFIDAVLALTEGRGGSFERDGDAQLHYRADGREPAAVFPFSRTGLPMAPKPHDLPLAPRPLTFIRPDRLAEFRRRAADGRLDVEKDVWPLVELEMELQYYRVVMGSGIERAELDACGDDGEAMRDVIACFLRSHPQHPPFDYRAVLDPVGRQAFADGAEFHAFVERYMEQEIARARLGLAGSGQKAAIAIWCEVRAALSPFMAFGGVTAGSQRWLMQQYYSRFKRVVFGPPIINIEKLLALSQAGVLDFSAARGPSVVGHEPDGCFELVCGATGTTVHAEILVDARYPAVDIERDEAPLYRNLRRRGMIRPFENRAASNGTPAYRPGAIDMMKHSRCVVDERGRANEDIAVIGIPTEGNLLGNLAVTRDEFASVWAADVLRQLHSGATP